jgi:hypothetical protein
LTASCACAHDQACTIGNGISSFCCFLSFVIYAGVLNNKKDSKTPGGNYAGGFALVILSECCHWCASCCCVSISPLRLYAPPFSVTSRTCAPCLCFPPPRVNQAHASHRASLRCVHAPVDWLLTIVVIAILCLKRSEVDNAPAAGGGQPALTMPPAPDVANPHYSASTPAPAFYGASKPQSDDAYSAQGFAATSVAV